MVRVRSELIRSSKRFKSIINKVKAKYILAGKKPPTTQKITEMIAKKMERNKLLEVLEDEFIRF